jgi:hypothetical protein
MLPLIKRWHSLKYSVVRKFEGSGLDRFVLLMYAFSYIQQFTSRKCCNGRFLNVMLCRAREVVEGEDTVASYHGGITKSSDKAAGHASLDVDRVSAACTCISACPSALRFQIRDPAGTAREHSRFHNFTL